MNLTLYFILMFTADAVNRLQLFHKHHGRDTGHHKRKSASSNRRERIRKETLKQICNYQMCAKCNKQILGNFDSELANKFCRIVINMSDCCSMKHMLFGRF